LGRKVVSQANGPGGGIEEEDSFMKKLSALVIVGLWILAFCTPASAARWLRDKEPAATTAPAFGPGVASRAGQDQTPPTGATVEHLINGGEQYLFNGLFADAVRWFSGALEKDPKSVKALSQRARAYLLLGGKPNCDKAFADAARVIELDPANKPIHFVLGEVFRERASVAMVSGDKKKAQELSNMALADYRIALEADPSSREIVERIGRTYAERGDLQEAVRVYAESLEKFQYSVELEKAFGDVLGQFLALKKEPDLGNWKFAYGVAGDFYYGKGLMDLAVKSYTRALELGNTRVLGMRARAYQSQGDFTAALADADQYVKVSENQYTYGLRAEIRSKAGDLDGAIADYSKAIKFQKKDIKSLPISDRFEELVRWYQKRGIVYEKKEAWGKAIQDYQEMDKFLKDGPARARLLWQIGLVYEQKGDAKNAQKYFSRATAMDPGLKK
jgi:tetratricopeptide (TPR) repeat protein